MLKNAIKLIVLCMNSLWSNWMFCMHFSWQKLEHLFIILEMFIKWFCFSSFTEGCYAHIRETKYWVQYQIYNYTFYITESVVSYVVFLGLSPDSLQKLSIKWLICSWIVFQTVHSCVSSSATYILFTSYRSNTFV